MRRPHETFIDKKRRWFHAGARDLAIACPELIKLLGPEAPPAYVCPLCPHGPSTVAFFEPAIEQRLLTAEHVPSEKASEGRGRRLVLTCGRCNHGAGADMDAAAANVEQGLRFLNQQGEGFVKVRAGDHELPARLTWDDGSGNATIRGLPYRPDAVAGFSEALGKPPGNREIHFRFEIRDPNDRLARVSWLKSAYLAMFALFGYRYAFNPALELVRRQIHEPTTDHIEVYSVRLPKGPAFSQNRVFHIRDSEMPRCWCVQMGPYLVFLPSESSGTLYQQIADLKRRRAEFIYHAKDSVWPTQPLFALADRWTRNKVASSSE